MALLDLFRKKEKAPQKNEAELKLHRCAFTGHRPERLRGMETAVIAGLRKEILAAIENGYTTFITGCSRGVDLWAADIVLELRRTNKSLRLICAVPFEGFESQWPPDWIKHYEMVRKQADWVEIIASGYSLDVYQKRNIWMANRATRLIAVWDGYPSGTKNTIEYAENTGLDMHIIKVTSKKDTCQ